MYQLVAEGLYRSFNATSIRYSTTIFRSKQQAENFVGEFTLMVSNPDNPFSMTADSVEIKIVELQVYGE